MNLMENYIEEQVIIGQRIIIIIIIIPLLVSLYRALADVTFAKTVISHGSLKFEHVTGITAAEVRFVNRNDNTYINVSYCNFNVKMRKFLCFPYLT